MKLAFVFIILATEGICQNYYITTSPSSEAGKDIYIVTEVGNTTEIKCDITGDDGNEPPSPIVVAIEWTLVNATTNSESTLVFTKDDGIATNFSFLSTSNPNLASLVDLTITNFTMFMDRMQIKCAATANNAIGATYVFGIEAPPTLKAGETFDATEDDAFSVSLFESAPFPPNASVKYVWRKENTELSNSSDTTLSDYNITIDPVGREHDGSYTLTVSTNAGIINGTFSLNVLFLPTGTKKFCNTSIIVHLGTTVTLPVGYTDVEANPAPVFIWTNSSGGVASNNSMITFIGKYAIDEMYQLTVYNITEDDIGIYAVGIVNELVVKNPNESVLVSTVELIQAIPPGQPTALNATIDDEYLQIILTWTEPDDPGTPPLTHYRANVISADNQNFDDVPLPSEDELTTLDTAMILLLYPGTVYNVSLIAVSELFPEGGLASQVISFELPFIGPVIQSLNISFSSSRLNVDYELVHTGGYRWDDVAVEVACDIVENFDDVIGSGDILLIDDIVAKDYGFYYNCTKDCLDENLIGSYEFSDQSVHAAMDYFCLIFADNGEIYKGISGANATATKGIPSVPEIVRLKGSTSGDANLSIKIDYVGVSSGENSFKIIVYYEMHKSTSGEQMLEFQFSQYTNGMIKTVTVESLSAGNYTFWVVASNQYGNSSRSISKNLTIKVDPSPTSTSTSPTSISTSPTSTSISPTSTSTSPSASTGAIVGGVIGGVVAAILVAVAVTVFIAIVYKFCLPKGKVAPNKTTPELTKSTLESTKDIQDTLL